VKPLKTPLIVFDIGNVLLRFSPTRAARNFNRLAPGLGKKLIGLIWNTQLGLDFERGRRSSAAFYRECLRRTGAKVSRADFHRAFGDIFTPLRGNLTLLTRLSQKHPTALLSNTNPAHWAHILKTYPDLKRARFRCASHLFKEMKPAPRVYRRLAKKTGFALKDMVYVDDHPDFVAAARRLGVRAFRFDGKIPLRGLLARAGIAV
jgi:HAD superfamily hydrolase (TIGR01509 family)